MGQSLQDKYKKWGEGKTEDVKSGLIVTPCKEGRNFKFIKNGNSLSFTIDDDMYELVRNHFNALAGIL